MKTNPKVLLALLLYSLLERTVFAFDLSSSDVAVHRAPQLGVNSDSLTNLTDFLSSIGNKVGFISDSSGLIYGGVSLFAIIIIVFVLRTALDSELKTLKSEIKGLGARLSETESVKLAAEERLKQELRKTKGLLEEKNSLVNEIEDCLRRNHALAIQLNETQDHLKTREAELKMSRSGGIGVIERQREVV